MPGDVDTHADIVVMAGDMSRAQDSVATTAAMFPNTRILIIVAGNHEHYRTSMSLAQGLVAMREQALAMSVQSGRQIIFLENNEVVVDVRGVQVRFLGCTLWTDYDLFGNASSDRISVERGLNDYSLILGSDMVDLPEIPGTGLSAVTTGELLQRHLVSRDFLVQGLARQHNGPSVVVTHHCPSMRSVPERYCRNPVSAGFSSRLDEIVAMDACLWVHGHTHTNFSWRDKTGTLVVCNPAGYGRGLERENMQFNPRLIVEISKQETGKKWRASIENGNHGEQSRQHHGND